MLCNAAIVIAAVLGVVSCENDLSPIGADLLGEDPSGVIKQADYDVKIYSAPVNPVQTSNFSSMPFGIYIDPVYGTSTYEFVTQLSLDFVNPDVGNNAELLDVRLEIPYFSTATGLSSLDAEETLYNLDSIYGESPVKFEVYRNNYFLNNFNADNLTERAVYYSDFKSTIENNQGELFYSDDLFYPVSSEVKITEFQEVDGDVVPVVVERLSPRLRSSLSDTAVERWKEILFNLDSSRNIIDARSELLSNSLFQDYFRGLYFKITPLAGEDGHMLHLNINEAKIVATIQSDSDVVSEEDLNGDGVFNDLVPNPESEITINFAGNRIGFISNEFNADVITDIQTSNDPINGAENVYLKGGPGALAVVELFGQSTNDVDGEAPALSDIIENDWLINDAYIEFYVNQSEFPTDFPGSKEPERILIYDYETNNLLSDYVLAQNSFDAVNANTDHLGRLERVDSDDESSDGVKYKIRLTQHLNNIIAGNIPNNKLAIVVSQNVLITANSSVLNTVNPNLDIESIPLSAAISHEGTILHGNLAQGTAGEFIEKRPKLTIRYSETN